MYRRRRRYVARRRPRRGRGIGSALRSINRALRSTKAISRVGSALGSIGVPYASQVGSVAGALGYGRRGGCRSCR